MSALTERIAAEHRWTLGEFLATNGVTYEWPSCACGLRLDDDDSPDHELHVAEVTEVAVREQIAADLTAQRIICPVHGIPDCSPLLNGCSRPNRIHTAVDKCIQIVKEGTP